MTTPVALSPALPSEILTWILGHQAYPTTLIICQPRAGFLTTLQASISDTIARQPPPPAEDGTPDIPPAPESEAPPARHPLLVPTLNQIATSRSINVVFMPTLSHLRAYLSVFPPETQEGKPPVPERNWDSRGPKKPLLVVYGFLGLHRDTSEWSAQGIGNSLAGVVEAGWRAGRKVVLLEERISSLYYGDDDRVERKEARKMWEERVPILNGSVRREGLENGGGGWSGRTVEVGRVLARWFKFGRGEWDLEDDE